MENNQKELVLLKDLGRIYANENSKQKRRFGLYKCFCGNEFKANSHSIKNGNTKSCGCYHKTKLSKIKLKHGFSSHRLYNVWTNMIKRCNNIENTNYKSYGARGITVCDRWLDINNFIEDMYPTFEDGLTLDRIDVNGNYEKDNCRWATIVTQNRNTQRINKINTSGYRGVSWHKKNKKWRTQIIVNNKNIHIGCYVNAIDGALAYDQYVIDNNLEHTKNFS